MKKEILVTKYSGEKVSFSEAKLRSSLQRAGANSNEIESIIDKVVHSLYEGISTKKIYHIAFKTLRDYSRSVAARYHLKRGIMELGPSGYPFEIYVGEIMKHQGYNVKVGVIEAGRCVSHEVDVIAAKNNQYLMIECKYHNLPGTICDVKIPLYIQARFKDIETEWIKKPELANKFCQGWVVTNTKFSTDAIRYGTCAGLNLIGWDYPTTGSIRESVDTFNLYPITCLTLLSKSEKQQLLNRKVVLCKDIHQNKQVLEEIGVKNHKISLILEEAQQLCNRSIVNVKNTPREKKK